jgi:thiamine pyrophosphokinase
MRTTSDQPPTGASGRHAIVIAGGDASPFAELDAAWPGWSDGADLVIAADSGWAAAQAAGWEPDLLVGDLDSLDPELARAAASAGVPILRSRVDKDESDTELAVLEALRRGARRITVLGALGGSRLDHELANVWLLAHPDLAHVEIAILDARTRVSLLSAPGPGGTPATRGLPGPVGAVVSLLPFAGDAEGVTTRGLRYPLAGEALRTGPSRGLSNERTAPDAAVSLGRGRLLIVEAAGPDRPAVAGPRVSSGA